MRHSLPAIAMVLALSAAGGCSETAEAKERFISAGERLVSLPATCAGTTVDQYERLTSGPLRDGERFKLTVNSRCGEDWRRSVSRMENLSCYEDMEGVIERSAFYGCLDQRDPAKSQIWLHFDDPTHVEFVWAKA